MRLCVKTIGKPCSISMSETTVTLILELAVLNLLVLFLRVVVKQLLYTLIYEFLIRMKLDS